MVTEIQKELEQEKEERLSAAIQLLNTLFFLRRIHKEVQASNGESETLEQYINIVEVQLRTCGVDPSVI